LYLRPLPQWQGSLRPKRRAGRASLRFLVSRMARDEWEVHSFKPIVWQLRRSLTRAVLALVMYQSLCQAGMRVLLG